MICDMTISRSSPIPLKRALNKLSARLNRIRFLAVGVTADQGHGKSIIPTISPMPSLLIGGSSISKISPSNMSITVFAPSEEITAGSGTTGFGTYGDLLTNCSKGQVLIADGVTLKSYVSATVSIFGKWSIWSKMNVCYSSHK